GCRRPRAAEAGFAGGAPSRLAWAPGRPLAAVRLRTRAARTPGAPPGSLPAAVLPPIAPPAGQVPGAPLAGDRGNGGPAGPVPAVLPLRSPAVLPGFAAAGADGRPRARRGCLAARHRRRRAPPGSLAGRTHGHRQPRRLRRDRLPALLPAAGPAAAADQPG